MVALFENRLAYLSVSLVLLVAGFPLVSIGTTAGSPMVWGAGLLALVCGGLIPPLQRVWVGRPLDIENDESQSEEVQSDIEVSQEQKEPKK